jgi:salicylate hydroxylase
VTEGEWREFATFAGPRLNKITDWNKVALIGDASHPLSGKFICHNLRFIIMSRANGLPGAFGSGATFAMEDGWILARALELTRFASRPTRDALGIFEQIRSPYYAKMYVQNQYCT